SIPYSATYHISAAIPTARFHLPTLVVLWSPNYWMTGWTYDLKIAFNCAGMVWFIPNQIIENLIPPNGPPNSSSDKRVMTYSNLHLTIGFGSCSTLWNAMRLEITTSFGPSATIPFTASWYNAFSATYPLAGIRSPSLQGDTYDRTCQLVWNGNQLTYNTSYWPLYHPNEIATLIEGPEATFEDISFYPEPE
ncbi:MAG: hypothetical protein HQL86_04870, partial [Magnetococcales bacterium]|nr:hypothetical protein [Magnetococcales bacterium]